MKIKEHRKESTDTWLCRAIYTFYLLSKLNSDIVKVPVE